MTTSLPGGASPFRFPLIWDSLILGNGAFIWNGRVDFVGAKRIFSWQHKQGPGVRGTVDTFRGTHTHPFEMHVLVWTDDQWGRLPDLLAFFKYSELTPGPDGEPLTNPVDISHPQLSYLDIHQVICEEIFAPDVDKERTGWAWCKFRLHEFLPPLPAVNVTATPVAAQTPVVVLNAGGGTTGAAIQSNTQAIANEGNTLPSTLP